MQIDVRNLQHHRLFTAQVDLDQPPDVIESSVAGTGDRTKIHLDWAQAIDDHNHLKRCPLCGCEELFVRKDFPQAIGFIIVLLAAVIAMIMFATRQVLEGFLVLGLVALIDAIIYLFSGRCLVCYRCRSEYRDLQIPRDHPGWELSTGEKYRTNNPGNTTG